jgi:hypothetical protein
MKLNELSVFAIVCLIIVILVVELVAVVLIAGAVASVLGFSGLLWWAVAIVVFLMINAILGALI